MIFRSRNTEQRIASGPRGGRLRPPRGGGSGATRFAGEPGVFFKVTLAAMTAGLPFEIAYAHVCEDQPANAAKCVSDGEWIAVESEAGSSLQLVLAHDERSATAFVQVLSNPSMARMSEDEWGGYVRRTFEQIKGTVPGPNFQKKAGIGYLLNSSQKEVILEGKTFQLDSASAAIGRSILDVSILQEKPGAESGLHLAQNLPLHLFRWLKLKFDIGAAQ